MLRRHIVLLIAIRTSDGDVKPGGPLGAFWKEQAMSQHQVSSSPFLSSSSDTAQLHYTNSYTYSHPNLNFLQYTIQILIPHARKVVCPSGAWFENRPHSTPSIHLAWNPKRVIVQWVGIRHTHSLLGTTISRRVRTPVQVQPFERSRIVSLREAGWTYQRIAAHVRHNVSVVCCCPQ